MQACLVKILFTIYFRCLGIRGNAVQFIGKIKNKNGTKNTPPTFNLAAPTANIYHLGVFICEDILLLIST